MKKLAIVILALMMAVLIIACGDKTAPSGGNGGNNILPPEQSDTPVSIPDNIDATGRTIVISDTEGNDARMTRGDDREYNAQAGTRMSDGYMTLTGDASHISLLFDGDSTVKTDELTRVTVEQISQNKLILVLLEGAFVADIAPLKAGASMEFKAGNVTFGIRGTSFIMEHRDADTVVVIMLSGSGYINEDKLLEAGQIAIVKSGEITINQLVIDNSLSDFAIYEIEQRDDGTLTSTPDDELLATALLDGTYEGELDANGKFTGFGVWTYYYYRYEGNFANGIPNGQGSLYMSIGCDGVHDFGMSHAMTIISQGTFVNGYLHGPIIYTWHMCTGETITWNFTMDMGYSTIINESIIADNGMSDLTMYEDNLIAVPPFIKELIYGDVPPL